MTSRWTSLIAFAALGACEAEPEPKKPSGPPPAKVCADARAGLEKLSKAAALDYDRKGGATIPQALWLQMPQDARDQLVHALAFDAACVAGIGLPEQEVVVNSEFGNVLTRRYIQTSVDVRELLIN